VLLALLLFRKTAGEAPAALSIKKVAPFVLDNAPVTARPVEVTVAATVPSKAIFIPPLRLVPKSKSESAAPVTLVYPVPATTIPPEPPFAVPIHPFIALVPTELLFVAIDERPSWLFVRAMLVLPVNVVNAPVLGVVAPTVPLKSSARIFA